MEKSQNRLATLLAFLLLICGPATAEQPHHIVDKATLRRKVLCGYQGWFRCPGDSAHEGWRHWSRDSKRIAPDTLTIEMWPDLSEYDDDEKYPAPGFTNPDGSPAQLFSSANAKTVDRHFGWMRDYGIDGVFLQHFAVDLPGGPLADRYASRRQVLDHVIAAAGKTGRVSASGPCLTISPACPVTKCTMS